MLLRLICDTKAKDLISFHSQKLNLYSRGVKIIFILGHIKFMNVPKVLVVLIKPVNKLLKY